MSKVLIDRALLERVQERLDPHRDAVLWGAVCDTFHTAPSGIPAMPVKAYYHEAPNEYGGFNKSVGLEVRKEFTDAPLVLESDALTQIACLEGEIAKRDARIVELESAAESLRLSRDYHHEQEIEYRRRLAGLYAAPVSEAKAQGVVMPEQDGSDAQKSFWAGFEAAKIGPAHWNIRAAWNEFKSSEQFKRLNAAPVQQVSVPDELLEMEWLEQWLLLAAEPTGQECCGQAHLECCGNAIHVYRTADEIAVAMNTRREELRSMLAATTAAPAAPAADAGVTSHD